MTVPVVPVRSLPSKPVTAGKTTTSTTTSATTTCCLSIVPKSHLFVWNELTIGLIVSHLINVVLTYILISAAISFKDATSAMAFYGVYHREPYNQLIHFFGVPGIIYSLYIYQCHLPITNYIVIDWMPLIPTHYVNWATIWLALYTIFYCSIDPLGATLYFPCSYAMYASAMRWVESDQKQHLYKRKDQKMNYHSNLSSSSWTGSNVPLYFGALIHLVSWYAQIKFGHQMIEGAQPALFQSIGGAFSTAPLFAFYEGVWYLGLQKQFQHNVMEQVSIYTKELCSKGIKMAACSTV